MTSGKDNSQPRAKAISKTKADVSAEKNRWKKPQLTKSAIQNNTEAGDEGGNLLSP